MAKLRIPLNFKEKDLNRTVYDLSQNKVTTLMQCLNIPIKTEVLKPKDHFTVDYKSMIDSMPMVGRQLNDWKLRISTFCCPLSNIYGWMDNNEKLSDSDMSNRRHFTISSVRISSDALSALRTQVFSKLGIAQGTSTTAIVNAAEWLSVFRGRTASFSYDWDYDVIKRLSVQAGSMLDYVGFPVGYVQSGRYIAGDFDSPNQNFNADTILSYLDVVRNYLVNNQYSSIPYYVVLPKFDKDFVPVIGDDDDYSWDAKYINMPLSSLDSFFKWLRMQPNGVDLVDGLAGYWLSIKNSNSTNLGDNTWVPDILAWLFSLSYGGMFLAQYEKDMLTNLLRNVNTDEVLIETDENGNFSINQLRFQNRRQLLKDRLGISGGRWSRILRAVWGEDTSDNMDIPKLVNTSSYFVGARSIMSTADTSGTDGASLGQLGGVFDTRDMDAHKFSIYSSDHSVMITIVSLVPDVLYTEGLGKGLDIVHFDDDYYPQYDALGFQDVPMYKYSALPSYEPTSGQYLADQSKDTYLTVVGKNIAFIDLISNVNRAHGHFGNDEYFETWILKRSFDRNALVPSLTPGYPSPNAGVIPYATPLEYQYPFTLQGFNEHNFVFQISFDIRAVRSKGKWFMPTLGK